MQQHPFIFSNERRYRLKRHVYFWVFWWAFMTILYAFVPGVSTLPYWKRMPNMMMDSLCFMPVHMFLSYSLMYFLIPKYVVKNKYPTAAVLALALFLLSAVFAALIAMYILCPVKLFVLPRSLVIMPKVQKIDIATSFCLSVLAGLRGGMTIGGLAAAIKLMKHWYVEGQRNLRLQKENVESQLQILKAQVHPHFLFNTLNNIYSFTQNTSDNASKMVMGLSDMLRYMLYECNQPLVPLSKEIKMTEEYISLEKIRYGNKLEVHVDMPKSTDDLYIAPLMLLPFIENCFKHGISNMLEQPWLNLHLSLTGNTMRLKIINSKPATTNADHQPGIGIKNVRMRLELLYPGKYELLINEEDEVFIVNLKLELVRIRAINTAPVQTAFAFN